MSVRVRGRDQFSRYKYAINAISRCYALLPKRARLALFSFHRRTRGKLGLVIRYALLKTIAAECGDNVAIFEDVYLFDPQHLHVGDNVSIHPMTYIDCGRAPEQGLHIGDGTGIAHGATIMSNKHTFDDGDVYFKDQPFLSEQIKIGRDVMICAKVTVVAGVTIGDGVVIGANAVVTKDIEPYQVCVGVPAVPIRKRKRSEDKRSETE